MRPATVVAVSIAIQAMGCHDEHDGLHLPEVSWSSEDFDFATDVDDPLCGGSLAFERDFVTLARTILGEPRDGQKFTYYLLSTFSFYQLFGSQVGGHYNPGRVFARAIPDLHESTHAVMDLSLGISYPALTEGVAEVFRDAGGETSPGLVSLAYALQTDGIHDKLPADAYARAGHFMAYALDVHGSAATRDLLALTRPGDTQEALHNAMAMAFNMSAEDLLADYEKYPLCRHSAYRWPITECSAGAAVEPTGGVWRIHADLDCGHSDVFGPIDGVIAQANVLDIPRAGQYRVSASGQDGDGAVVVLGHCSPGCAEDKGMTIELGVERVVTLRQGRYHVTTKSGRGAASATLQTTIKAVDPGGLAAGGG